MSDKRLCVCEHWHPDDHPADARQVGWHGLRPIVEWQGRRWECWWQSPCEHTGAKPGWWYAAIDCANCGSPATTTGTLDSEPFARDVPLCKECSHGT